VADEVSTGELARRLERMENLLLKLVNVDVYGRDRREDERRFAELERDLTDERAAREAAVKALHDRLDKAGTNWRQALYSGLIPGLFFLLSMAVTILLAIRGGK
jgi:hypothetical protein